LASQAEGGAVNAATGGWHESRDSQAPATPPALLLSHRSGVGYISIHLRRLR